MRILIILLLITTVYAADIDRCGDNICNPDEHYFNCPNDCRFEPPVKKDYRSACGNGVCEDGEDHRVCNADCIAPYQIEENKSQNVMTTAIVFALLAIFGILIFFFYKATMRSKVTFKNSLTNLEQRSSQELKGDQTTFSSLSQKIHKGVTKQELMEKMKKSKEYREMMNNGQ